MKNKWQTFLTKLTISLLNLGVILATAHSNSALAAADAWADQAAPLSKIQSDSHTHSELASTFKALNSHHYIDPKSLRKIRSEGDKSAEADSDLSGWDVYQV
jgi:hypothetical protein